MTKEEIIEMARWSGLGMLLEVGGMDKCLEHFAKLIAEKAIEEALAQPEQEPVAWMDKDGDVLSASVVSGKGLRNIPLYTTPPQIKGCAECGVNGGHALYCVACAEKYLEDKNTREKQCQDKKVK